MKNKTDYLLKYIQNTTYQRLLEENHSFTIENLIDNRVDVELNIRYFLQYGVKNIDQVVLERIDDLLLPSSEFIQKMNAYEEKLGAEEFINMLENS